MIKSMTGYGKSVVELPNRVVNIEIKTLNSKQFDIHLRIPNIYKGKEPEIRQIASSRLERGKIDVSINIENTGNRTDFVFNKSLAKSYFTELREIADSIGEAEQVDFLPLIVRLPDVLAPALEEPGEAEWKTVVNGINEAIRDVDVFRKQEGDIIAADFDKRIRIIENHLNSIAPLEVQRTENIRSRVNKKLLEFFDKNLVDENRFEQEMIYYLEKLDITEEKVRLKKHIDYFLSTMKDNISNGKKLNFIAQEIGREINTIGSKANDAGIQKIVVEMKDELEKIKEQLLNIL